MADPLTIEFYKMAVGGGVGRVLHTTIVPADFFNDREAFKVWVQDALPARRGNPQIWEWPEAVRVVSPDGAELYSWTLWDQFQAGKALVKARRA